MIGPRMPCKLAQNSRCCKELEPQAVATEQFLSAETVADVAVDFLVRFYLTSGPFFETAGAWTPQDGNHKSVACLDVFASMVWEKHCDKS